MKGRGFTEGGKTFGKTLTDLSRHPIHQLELPSLDGEDFWEGGKARLSMMVVSDESITVVETTQEETMK